MRLPEGIHREVSPGNSGVKLACRGQKPPRLVLPAVRKGQDLGALQEPPEAGVAEPLPHPVILRPDAGFLLRRFQLHQGQGKPVHKQRDIRTEAAGNPGANHLRCRLIAVPLRMVEIDQPDSPPSVPQHPVEALAQIRAVQGFPQLLQELLRPLLGERRPVHPLQGFPQRARKNIGLPVPFHASGQKNLIPQPGKMQQGRLFHQVFLPSSLSHGPSPSLDT